MLSNIIRFSIRNKFLILLFTAFLIVFGVYALTKVQIGAVPDITNNQVQVITTSQNLSTQDVEQFITFPVELEMANLPGVEEIRSVSKFGLSVVTIVFDDDMGTYLPRQLIAEKIKSATEQIPNGFGVPEMGPISTGLGEIYQYILDTKPGYEDQYSVMELRTIQDWIVRRQLSGIPGVVEVITWGGYLKQYEVAINTQRLNSMDITAEQVFTALEKNNSVAGGGYIEKGKETYFIRGEGMIKSLEDVENIVVTKKGTTPVLIKDIGNVNFGHANRFGAITGNGTGEKVMGQVMMLKDANSKEVIDAVKKRVEEISASLPEGVFINGFLERSQLIEKTTYTISENLILGCLIVIFVVVLLLGNFRSGLVIASVIPLCLLFALSLMYIFGVDANLMSLGAIDFGIIIDGAVIIVEFIAFQMTRKADSFMNLNKSEQLKLKDEITLNSANKMMNSAIFGQLIILLVFIPIFSLQSVEGKMFKPMAITFSFALIGAMILCFTYVPVVASIFLKPTKASSKNISNRLMNGLNNMYNPVINWSLGNKKTVLGLTVVIFLVSIFTFTRMGSEFVPTLDEGDFVIQPVLKTGTSLSETIEMCTKMEKLLLDNFPEIKQVVSRIGAAEVPTDPMSMEQSDVIITLKGKSEWTSAKSKDELANLFKEKLEIFGIEVEFTQPIEMRFNELITGVRADIAIKIFGEDLTVLDQKANQIKTLISSVKGAADVIVEKTVGLPQMQVKFDRKKIARYGVNIFDLNQLVSLSFAGMSAGSVFEGEKRFDLVLRLDQSHRKDIDNLQNLYVDLPNGGKVPLRELADITYEKGAAMISRDDTKRRVVVGVNVRERDMQSVVDDIQSIVNRELDLPPGYSIHYGGQFENLESARNRLLIAVPIALILIFIMLYFAFHSVKEAALIFSAIPLAAVGGILLLFARDMPFSISAGVGFIALFGIAVLNGIVMIEHFKELKKEGELKGDELIVKGAKDRLRAVLLTASAAALGFLPMALSTNVGAEVQRPLATVVIGGLITATLLTLIVLPVLYSMYQSSNTKKLSINTSGLFLVLFSLGGFSFAQGQESISYDDLLQLAQQNNGLIKSTSLQVQQNKALINSGYNFDKTNVYYNYDESNLVENNVPLNIWGVSQNFSFPTIYGAQRKLNKAKFNLSSKQLIIQQQYLEQTLAIGYQEFLLAQEQVSTYAYLDSLFTTFNTAAKRKYELGGSNYLEMLTAQSKKQQVEVLLKQAQEEITVALQKLNGIVQADSINPEVIELQKLPIILHHIKDSPVQDYFDGQKRVIAAQENYQKQQWLPDISLEYFQGSNQLIDRNYIGYTLGLKIPLLFNAQASKVKASKIATQVVMEQAKNYQLQLQSKFLMLKAEMNKFNTALSYYESEGKQLSEELIKASTLSYKAGELDYFQFIQSLENASKIKLIYLDNLNRYNIIVIQINHLTLN